jgi:hypothetical protein
MCSSLIICEPTLTVRTGYPLGLLHGEKAQKLLSSSLAALAKSTPIPCWKENQGPCLDAENHALPSQRGAHENSLRLGD